MSTANQITYSLDFAAHHGSRTEKQGAVKQYKHVECVSRIARLLALAIRMERMIQERVIQDYAALSRLGWVTRARMTQIMKLLNLAPDIQEQILFLPPVRGLNERNLRPISHLIDWYEQRRLFEILVRSSSGNRE